MADVQVTVPSDRDIFVPEGDDPSATAAGLLAAAAAVGLPARVVRVAPQPGGYVVPAALVADGAPSGVTITLTRTPAAGDVVMPAGFTITATLDPAEAPAPGTLVLYRKINGGPEIENAWNAFPAPHVFEWSTPDTTAFGASSNEYIARLYVDSEVYESNHVTLVIA